MYCRNCGTQLSENTAFCNKCGTPQSVHETHPQMRNQQQEEYPQQLQEKRQHFHPKSSGAGGKMVKKGILAVAAVAVIVALTVFLTIRFTSSDDNQSGGGIQSNGEDRTDGGDTAPAGSESAEPSVRNANPDGEGQAGAEEPQENEDEPPIPPPEEPQPETDDDEISAEEPEQVEHRQLSNQEIITGEWFYDFPFYNSVVSYMFYANGSGAIFYTDYTHNSTRPGGRYPEGYTGVHNETSFTWSFDGTTVRITEPDDNTFELTLMESSERANELHWSAPRDGWSLLTRVKTDIPDDYIMVSSLIGESRAIQDALIRKFIGTWYFDVTTWTFNQDGTGVIDIPEIFGNPEEQMHFTYTVMEHMYGKDANIAFTFPDGTTLFSGAEFGNRSGGSVILDGFAEDLLFTREFDMNNAPYTTQAMKDGYSIVTGQAAEAILNSIISP